LGKASTRLSKKCGGLAKNVKATGIGDIPQGEHADVYQIRKLVPKVWTDGTNGKTSKDADWK